MRMLLLALVGVLSVGQAHARLFYCDANPPEQKVTSYRFWDLAYPGAAPKLLCEAQASATPTCSATIADGPHWLSASAVRGAEESLRSEPVFQFVGSSLPALTVPTGVGSRDTGVVQ